MPSKSLLSRKMPQFKDKLEDGDPAQGSAWPAFGINAGFLSLFPLPVYIARGQRVIDKLAAYLESRIGLFQRKD